MVSNLKTDETEIELSKEDKNFASKKKQALLFDVVKMQIMNKQLDNKNIIFI